MAGKKRIVYFFEVVEYNVAEEKIEAIAEGFWPKAHQFFTSLDIKKRRVEYRGRKYEGEALQEHSPPHDYIYLAKLRPGADWPDVRTSSGTRTNLAQQTTIAELMEPAYLLPVSGTNYVAIMRTSGGPTFSGIEHWLSAACGYDVSARSLVLRPYSRKDTIERLDRASGASRIHLKVDPDVMEDSEPESALGKAVKEAQNLGSGGASVEMIVSFGHARPDDTAGREMIEGLTEILNTAHPKKAKATLLRTDDDGHFEKDKIDLIRDRVTVTEEVGDDENDLPSPAVVLTAMSGAIQKFRKALNEESNLS